MHIHACFIADIFGRHIQIERFAVIGHTVVITVFGIVHLVGIDDNSRSVSGAHLHRVVNGFFIEGCYHQQSVAFF